MLAERAIPGDTEPRFYGIGADIELGHFDAWPVENKFLRIIEARTVETNFQFGAAFAAGRSGGIKAGLSGKETGCAEGHTSHEDAATKWEN